MRSALLRSAFPLIKTHGFTRHTLALAALALPDSPHSEPLSQPALSALFGFGEEARRTLINAWLDEGIKHMGSAAIEGRNLSVRDALSRRLSWNEPVLEKLPEVLTH
jgi:ubiquinone biosynthesis protein COQ9